jgi:hypothetical protein
MLLASCYRVHDAPAFVDAFIEAAAASKDWALDYIKFDYGFQFVYVKYIGRRFQGKGLKASACYRLSDPTTLHATIHADEWPTHVHGDKSAMRLVKPLLEAAHEASRPKLKIVQPPPTRTPARPKGRRSLGQRVPRLNLV